MIRFIGRTTGNFFKRKMPPSCVYSSLFYGLKKKFYREMFCIMVYLVDVAALTPCKSWHIDSISVKLPSILVSVLKMSPAEALTVLEVRYHLNYTNLLLFGIMQPLLRNLKLPVNI